jgi:aspartate kinase
MYSVQPHSLKATVLKFGGTSLADATGFQRVQQIERERRELRPVVVVSAMRCVTDLLLESLRAAKSGEVAFAEQIVAKISSRHLAIARELLATQYEAAAREIYSAVGEISAHLDTAATANSPALEDLICSYGERLSAGLLAAVFLENGLPSKHVDARLCIVTDSNHGNAEPLIEKSEQQTRAALGPLIDASLIPVLGGFIGMSEDGETTTLGRNGSDYTASIVGSALDAREIQIWSDVPGVMTADPRLVRNARTISQLSYAEAAELAHFGAKVLHHKMIQPAAKRRIPVRVRNTFESGVLGTLVCSQHEKSTTVIKAIAHKTGLMVLQITPFHLGLADSQLYVLLSTFRRHHVEIYAATTSITRSTFIIDGASMSPLLMKDLNEMADVTVDACDGVFVIGGAVSCVPDILKRLHGMFGDSEQVLPSQSTYESNLILAVAPKRTNEVVTRLHSIFVEAVALPQQMSGG